MKVTDEVDEEEEDETQYFEHRDETGSWMIRQGAVFLESWRSSSSILMCFRRVLGWDIRLYRAVHRRVKVR